MTRTTLLGARNGSRPQLTFLVPCVSLHSWQKGAQENRV